MEFMEFSNFISTCKLFGKKKLSIEVLHTKEKNVFETLYNKIAIYYIFVNFYI